MAVNKLEVVPWTVAANELTHIRHQVFVVEQNHGKQLYHYLRGQMDFRQTLHSYAMAGPVPLNAGQIAQTVAEVLAA